ncbi:chascon isoform d-related [Anaeramoeba flamelloides]|uniref:Chascon isoform d-related n=1 Tax=Anaeramoeba flamelloides TaxID=1746091 RepID=A0AAV7ZSV6_9EUKA|nr:chascon isoform d-related [Anaeramoeba flamelloides]
MSGYLKLQFQSFKFLIETYQSFLSHLIICVDDRSTTYLEIANEPNKEFYYQVDSPFSKITFSIGNHFEVSDMVSPIQLDLILIPRSKRKRAEITFKSPESNEAAKKKDRKSVKKSLESIATGKLTLQVVYTNQTWSLLQNYKLIKQKQFKISKQNLQNLIANKNIPLSITSIARALLAIIEVNLENTTQAFDQLELVQNFDPTWYQIFIIKGVVYYINGEYNEALDNFQKYLKNYPTNELILQFKKFTETRAKLISQEININHIEKEENSNKQKEINDNRLSKKKEQEQEKEKEKEQEQEQEKEHEKEKEKETNKEINNKEKKVIVLENDEDLLNYLDKIENIRFGIKDIQNEIVYNEETNEKLKTEFEKLMENTKGEIYLTEINKKKKKNRNSSKNQKESTNEQLKNQNTLTNTRYHEEKGINSHDKNRNKAKLTSTKSILRSSESRQNSPKSDRKVKFNTHVTTLEGNRLSIQPKLHSIETTPLLPQTKRDKKLPENDVGCEQCMIL